MSAGSWLFSMFATKTTADDWLRYHRALRDLGTYLVIVGVIVETLIDELWEIDTPPLLRGIRATTLLKTKAARLKMSAWQWLVVVSASKYGKAARLMTLPTKYVRTYKVS
jgi:hypothetical protein